MQTRFWAIGDTHLSLGKPKDMAHFGERWARHRRSLAEAWRATVRPEDVVLVAGDISWAQTINRVLPDLAWLAALPGRKVLLRGNHDHWWKDIVNVRKIVQPLGFYALEGDSIEIDGVIVCGAMGHLAPRRSVLHAGCEENRYHRELTRLELALEHAARARRRRRPVLLMMHYPPFTSEGKPTAFTELISLYQPTICMYGHLHRGSEWETACNGMYNGVEYALVAADYRMMVPYQVWPLTSTDKG